MPPQKSRRPWWFVSLQRNIRIVSILLQFLQNVKNHENCALNCVMTVDVEENSGLSVCSLHTYCVLQETDLSLLAHWDRDCIRTREVSNSYQHIAALHAYVCLFYTHTVLHGCFFSHTTFCTFVLKVCVSVHSVACCAMQVLPCDAFFYVCVGVCTFQTVLYHTARRRPKWTWTPCDGFGQAETTHTRYTHTLANAVALTHTQTRPPADPITQRCATRWKKIYPENQLI